MITATNLTVEEKLREENADLRLRLALAMNELRDFRSDNGMPSSLQQKISRQAKALTSLNRRVRVQRLILRELNENHSELATDLFNMVSDKYPKELNDDIVLQF